VRPPLAVLWLISVRPADVADASISHAQKGFSRCHRFAGRPQLHVPPLPADGELRAPMIGRQLWPWRSSARTFLRPVCPANRFSAPLPRRAGGDRAGPCVTRNVAARSPGALDE